MDVQELYHLSDWYLDQFAALNRLYNGILGPLQNNANQGGQQPLESQLEALLDHLRAMEFQELSLQQIQTLSRVGVDQYIGENGAKFVESIIKTSNFDPASASLKVSEAINKLSTAQQSFSAYKSSTELLSANTADDISDQDSIIIRIGFQDRAAIENLTDWKESAKEWYDIIRGLALASGEPPENTKVIGASTGSIILILAGTVSVTTLLALISKNIASVAKEAIGISNQIEDLRHKKILNETIETELRKIEKSKK